MWPHTFIVVVSSPNSPAVPRRLLPHASKHSQNVLVSGWWEKPLKRRQGPVGLGQWG